MIKKISIFIIIILSLPTFYYLTRPGYFSMHDDLQIMRIYELERCFNDGQIPCRWSPDMTFGYGQAMFNFYSVLPYYFGFFIKSILAISIIDTVKILFLLSLVVGSIGMFLLSSEFWGVSIGILSSLFYAYAPYRALDIYVRGALAESFALAFYPFVWYLLYKLIEKRRFKWMALSSIFLAFLFMTHNISTMIFFPFSVLWVIFWIIKFRKVSALQDLFLSGVLGLGMASFFLVPAFFERGLIKDDLFTQDYFEFHAHFVSLRQLFWDREWGFGPSIFGDRDDLSFQVGIVHVASLFLGGTVFIIRFLFLKKRDYKDYLFAALGAFSIVALFMAHSRSTFLWFLIPTLSYVQFPWRFIGISVFLISLSAGYFFQKLGVFRYFFIFLAGVALVFFNYSYFKPEHLFYSETDETKLSGELFNIQKKAAPLDYLPITADNAPEKFSPEKPFFESGFGDVRNFVYRTNYFFFDAEVYEKGRILVPIIYFPEWVILVNDNLYEFEIQKDNGLIALNLEKGKYMVRGRFENTTIRDFANGLSIISFTALFFLYIAYINKNKVLWYKD